MTITIGNKRLEDIINEVSRQVYGIPFSNNEDIKEDRAMNRDEQLKKLKAFVNDLLSHHGNLRSGAGVYHLMKNHELIVDGERANWLSEKPFYRVALFKDENGLYTRTADD